MAEQLEISQFNYDVTSFPVRIRVPTHVEFDELSVCDVVSSVPWNGLFADQFKARNEFSFSDIP